MNLKDAIKLLEEIADFLKETIKSKDPIDEIIDKARQTVRILDNALNTIELMSKLQK